jgi:hypothetical protein
MKKKVKIVRLIDAVGEKRMREAVLDGTDNRDLADHADSQFGAKNTRGAIVEISRRKWCGSTKTYSFGCGR